MKKCLACQKIKGLELFPPDKRAKDKKQSRCRDCINAWMKVHYRKNPAWSMWRRARARAAKKGFACTITVEHLIPLPKICPVLGIKLRLSENTQDPAAYSLDRSDNKKGYIPGNIVVMSYKANRLKNDGTAEEHDAIAKWMKSLTLNKRRKNVEAQGKE